MKDGFVIETFNILKSYPRLIYAFGSSADYNDLHQDDFFCAHLLSEVKQSH